MTVPRPSGQFPVRAHADVVAEQVLGPRTAKRLATFRDGVRYVEAGGWARFLAWLVDVVVMLLGLGLGVIVVGGVADAADIDSAAVALGMIAVLFLVPLLYGWSCYRNGRALGPVLTGTWLVRAADGCRIGGKPPWAMLMRLLMPLLFIGALGSGGSSAEGSSARVSVDPRASRQLRAAAVT